jgi:hypothetical protein
MGLNVLDELDHWARTRKETVWAKWKAAAFDVDAFYGRNKTMLITIG